MIYEDTLTVQTLELKVNSIHCDVCLKNVKKVLRKIDGVYQITVDAANRKVMVTVSGQMDPDIVMKKLHKAGTPAQLWDEKPAEEVTQIEELQLSGGDGDKEQQEAKDAECNGKQQQPEDATRQRPGPESEAQGFSGQWKQWLRRRREGCKDSGATAPAADGAAAPAEDADEDADAIPGADKNNGGGSNGGCKECGDRIEIPVQIKMGGGPADAYLGMPRMLPHAGMMMKPPNRMGAGIGQIGGSMTVGGNGMPLGYPHMGGAGLQLGGSGGAFHSMPAGGVPGAAGFFPVVSGMPAAGTEMLPMSRQPSQQQQQHMVALMKQQMMMMMMMDENGQHAHHAGGGRGYPVPPVSSSYGYGYGRPMMPEYPPMYNYPMPQRHPHDNMFSDENPNACSMM